MRIPILFFPLALSLTCGCQKEPAEKRLQSDSLPQPRAAVTLTVLVVDDSKLAAGLTGLRGEWAERSRGQLVVVEATSTEFVAAEELSADLVIYPSRYVGTLVARDSVRPVSRSILSNDAFARADLLPLVRNRVMPYGGKIYALSLGEPPLMLARPGADLSEKFPLSWSQFDEQRFALIASKQIEHAAAVEFLVLAIGYVNQANRSAILFDPETMQPRIDSPPFVRALAEMIKRRKRASADQTTRILVLPPAVTVQAEHGQSMHLGLIPVADEVYDYVRESWEPNESLNSPVMLGFSGRVMSVTRTSRNAASAFKLLEWLSHGEIATKLSQLSDGTVWFRASQIMQSPDWLSRRGIEKGAAAITRQLLAENCFHLPRIPAIDKYLQAVDAAVVQALAGELAPTQALESAAEQWEAITTDQNRNAQAAAYRKHLGYGEFAD
jgi:multiple sugar transport system substrate-binding protein